MIAKCYAVVSAEPNWVFFFFTKIFHLEVPIRFLIFMQLGDLGQSIFSLERASTFV